MEMKTLLSSSSSPFLSSFLPIPIPIPNPIPLSFPNSYSFQLIKPTFLNTYKPQEGTGASAPSRADIFYQTQSNTSTLSIIKDKEIEKNMKKNKVVSVVEKVVYGCYGCGAPLQVLDEDDPGFVHIHTYHLFHFGRPVAENIGSILARCQLLSHGHMITAVGGNGGYSGGKQFISAEELRDKLSHLRHEKALVVKLVDIVDFNGSFLSRVRDLAGANPIILVITKVDLLPKGTDFNCIGDWVVEATMKKKLNVLSVHLTSSKSLVGIAGVVAEIQKEKKGRDVYILGSANVGKSAFISALLKMLSYKDPVAAAAEKYKPIQSAVPGTTLGPIQINAFLGGGKVFDTPGVHLHHRQAAVIHSEDLPALAPQSRLRGQSLPVDLQGGTESIGLKGFSIFWGGLVRIDVLQALPETRLTFYGPKAVQIHLVPTDKADEFYQREVGTLLTPPRGKEKADSWAGLQTRRDLHIKFEDVERPACDVAISGLGWITIEPIGRPYGVVNSDMEPSERKELHFVVHVPKPVEIFVRSPLPVGKNGPEWYQYRDLTDKEEEVRPKWYF